MRPVCLVAREVGSGRTLRLWADEFAHLRTPPYAIDADSLFVAYYASAECGCHEALGWPLPENVLDLFAEFRTHTNGSALVASNSLLGALAFFGLPGIAEGDKEAMRELIMSDGPWDAGQHEAILDYCESDVDALARLLPAMDAIIDLPRALLRGRYMKAVARIETVGVPIDLPLLQHLRQRWDSIQDALIAP